MATYTMIVCDHCGHSIRSPKEDGAINTDYRGHWIALLFPHQLLVCGWRCLADYATVQLRKANDQRIDELKKEGGSP